MNINIKNIDNKIFIIIIGLIIMISILFALIFTFKKRKDEIENIPLEEKTTLKDVYILKEDSLKKIYLNKDSINNFDSTDIIRFFNEY